MSTTRFPNGVTTAGKLSPKGEFILPDPVTAHTYWEDFNRYNAADWTVTDLGAATQALTDADGGRLLISNAAAINDDSLSQKVGNSFRFVVGEKLWFDCKFQVNETTLSSWIFGLMETTTTPENAQNGVHFQSNGGTTEIIFHVEAGAIQLVTPSFANAENATDIRLSFIYDGIDKIDLFVNGSMVLTVSAALIPVNTDVTPTYFVHNSESASKTMSVDYIMTAKER